MKQPPLVRLWQRACALWLASLGAIAGLSGAAVASPQATLSACGNAAYPPWNWAQGGRMYGTCVEVAVRAFASAGVRLEVRDVGPWARCQLLVETGAIDVNICALDNAKRREHSVFVETPMGYNEAAVFVPKTAQLQYNGWDDLLNQRVGMARGVSLGTEFDAFLAKHPGFEQAQTEEHNFRKLLAQRIDVVVTGRELGRLNLRVLGCTDQVRDLPKPVVSAKLHIQMSKRSKHLEVIPKVEAFLNRPQYPQLRRQLHEQFTDLYLQTQQQRSPADCTAQGAQLPEGSAGR